MSAADQTNLNTTESEHVHNFGSRVMKSFSKRMANYNNSKDTAEEENTTIVTSQSDTAGIVSGIGSSNERTSQEKAAEIGSRIFGHKPSVNPYKFNDDIRKGPITKGSFHATGGSGAATGSAAALAGAAAAMAQSQSEHAEESGVDQRDTTQARLAGEGSSSQGGIAQPVSSTQNTTTTEDPISQELEEQSHIDSDVFSSGPSNEAAARGLSGSKDATEATHAPKGHPTQAKHKWTYSEALKQGGTGASSHRATTSGQSSLGMSSADGLGLGAMGFMGAGAMGAGVMGARGGLKRDTTEGGLRQSAFTRGDTSAVSTTTTSGVQGTRAVRSLNGSNNKVTVLQERIQAVTQKCKNQFGLSASEISKRSPTVDAFFDAVAAERLRWMPGDGSRLDCCLRWASRLAYAVDALRASIGAFAPGANEAAKLIWGFEILLLEVSSSK